MVPFQFAVAKVAPGVSPWVEARYPVLATLLMAPVVWWVRDSIHPLAAVIAGAVVYVTALWSLGGVDNRQRTLAGRALARARASPAPASLILSLSRSDALAVAHPELGEDDCARRRPPSRS